MSSAALRRYRVQFIDWTLYETFVFAGSEKEAITKVQAFYHADGLAGFSFRTAGDEGWEAEEVQS